MGRVGREVTPPSGEWRACCPRVGTRKVDVHFIRGIRWRPATAHDPYVCARAQLVERNRLGLSCGARYVGDASDRVNNRVVPK